MKLIAGAVAAAAAACVFGQYQPNWASLDTRPLPQWYDDAKFGIFIHWGVFSVPSWGTEGGGASGEWFWWDWMGAKDPEYAAFVNATQAPGWSYAQYGAQFTAELWDPAAWASLFKQAGAQYVVLTTKHHEGWTNWPSNVSFNWDSVSNGPHRDLVGDLSVAIKAQGIHWGVYHSLFEWFNPLYLQDKANGFNTSTFVTAKTMPELYDLVNSYAPELIWSDGDWEAPDTYWQSTQFLAWLVNESPVKDTVVFNDRWGANDICHHGSYYTCNDRYNPGTLQNHKWENALTIDQYSWGYRRNALLTDYLPSSYFISELASTVSCGGNMLLNIGPAKDGTISPVFQERLLDIGAWLSVNGEAIYASRPWRAQNDTAANAWYTQQPSTGAVYAIVLTWPANNVVSLTVPVSSGNTAVSLLGWAGAVSWQPAAGGTGITVTLPALTPATLPCQHAWVLKMTNVK